jgi:hypothetical protein
MLTYALGYPRQLRSHEDNQTYSKSTVLNRPGTNRPATWQKGLDAGGQTYTSIVELKFHSFTYAPPGNDDSLSKTVHTVFFVLLVQKYEY